jgi:toxin-antitoxin system PIN domain toxin
MPVHLMDVNVLVALMWPAHIGHQKVHHWFQRNSSGGWATCPFTQAAFVRIVSNPAFSPQAVTPKEAINTLVANLRHPQHRFWADDLSFSEAAQPFSKRLIGHKQVTDAYVLGLARHKKGRVVSFDRGLLELVRDEGSEHELVVLL